MEVRRPIELSEHQKKNDVVTCHVSRKNNLHLESKDCDTVLHYVGPGITIHFSLETSISVSDVEGELTL